MSVTSQQLETKLRAAFNPVFVEVVDESGGCGAKFAVSLASSAFDGVALLQRHRLVNAAIAEEVQLIHAITIKAMTPAQYEAKKGQ